MKKVGIIKNPFIYSLICILVLPFFIKYLNGYEYLLVGFILCGTVVGYIIPDMMVKLNKRPSILGILVSFFYFFIATLIFYIILYVYVLVDHIKNINGSEISLFKAGHLFMENMINNTDYRKEVFLAEYWISILIMFMIFIGLMLYEYKNGYDYSFFETMQGKNESGNE